MPLPREEVTPPVTKMYLTLDMRSGEAGKKSRAKVGFYGEWGNEKIGQQAILGPLI